MYFLNYLHHIYTISIYLTVILFSTDSCNKISYKWSHSFTLIALEKQETRLKTLFRADSPQHLARNSGIPSMPDKGVSPTGFTAHVQDSMSRKLIGNYLYVKRLEGKLFVRLSTCLFVCLSIYLLVYLSVQLDAYADVWHIKLIGRNRSKNLQLLNA